MDPETHYRLLRLLESQPHLSQRELARELGVSLGKVNYCLRALIEKGWVKAGNFRRNPDKQSYAYLLTPKGMRKKAQITVKFLQRKLEEYDRLEAEIAELRQELATANSEE